MSNQLGRLTQQILVNKSGAGVAYGDVVVIDTANANAFKTTTTGQYVDTPIGVCIEPNGILNNAQGMIAFGGAIGRINLDTAAAIGDWIHTFTVAGQGHPHTAPVDAGDFAVALEASSTPKALINSGGSGGGGATNVPTVILTLTNQTGGSVNQGDVVLIDTANANSFSSDSIFGAVKGESDFLVGVVLDTTIGIGASGKVIVGGYAPKVNMDASTGVGSYIMILGASLQATLANIPGDFIGGGAPGTFGYLLDTGTAPPALIWNPPLRPQEIRLGGQSANLNTGTAQILASVPPGFSALITRIIIRNASVSLTTVSFSIGWNSASFNDVVADATHTEINSATVYTVLVPKIGAAVGTTGSSLKLKNNVLQGAPASANFEVFGYIFP